MSTFNQLAGDAILATTAEALRKNGMDTFVVENGQEAKKKVLEMLPNGAEVMTMSSVTLDTIGLTAHINDSREYDSVRKKLMTLDVKTQWSKRQKLGASPDWVIGSVQAVTTDGKVIIVSNSGSQLPAYASGAAHVIWVVGTQKIVSDLNAAMKRIYDHTLALEEVRAQKVYGVGSAVNKILIINKENAPGRITMILVKEVLGY